MFKKGDPEDLNNYRPISLLPSFSKIFESAMNSRLTDFFKMYDLLNNQQHGFQKGKSTQTALFDLMQAILN